MNDKYNIRGIVLLLIFLPVFILQSWKIPLVYAWYYTNKEAITYEFCINKNRPELLCAGKCHLQKVISNYESTKEDWKNLATKSIDKRTITLIKDTHSLVFEFGNEANSINSSFLYLFNYSLSSEKMIFRPPRSLS